MDDQLVGLCGSPNLESGHVPWSVNKRSTTMMMALRLMTLGQSQKSPFLIPSILPSTYPSSDMKNRYFRAEIHQDGDGWPAGGVTWPGGVAWMGRSICPCLSTLSITNVWHDDFGKLVGSQAVDFEVTFGASSTKSEIRSIDPRPRLVISCAQVSTRSGQVDHASYD